MSVARKNLMLGTAGHVDHGKTALVKALTGCDTDTLAEEKRRGLTIDLGFAPWRMADGRVVGIVDVPGHVDFVRNMVAGAHGIDIVILVVAADDGVMPQTREHLDILSLMGLRHGLVALTKIDLVAPEMRELVSEDIRGLLAGTFLEGAPICPMSNVTGEGYEGFFDALNQQVAACEGRADAGLFRAWVSDVFTIRGFGTVVTGIPTSGVVRVGDRLCLLPAGSFGRVRRLEVYGEDATVGRAGECVALNLSDFDHESIHRGMVLCESEALQPVTMAEAELQILPTISAHVKDYAEVHFHIGTAVVLARLALLEGGDLTPGQRQMVQVRLAKPLALAPGERFVIRANVAGPKQSGLTTIGGGRVLGVSNVRLRRKRPWTLAALAARKEVMDDPLCWCELMLYEAGQPSSLAALADRCLLHPEELSPLLQSLRAMGRLVEADSGVVVHREVMQAAAGKMLEAIKAFHVADPQRVGIDRECLFGSLGGEGSFQELALQALERAGQVAVIETRVAAAGWSPRLFASDLALCDRLAQSLQRAGYARPTGEELAATVGESPERVQAMLGVLVDRGVAVELTKGLVVHREAVVAAQPVALELLARGPSFSTMQFRDALGVSRKYAVPLLDDLDKTHFTVREGHDRTAGAGARDRLLAEVNGSRTHLGLC